MLGPGSVSEAAFVASTIIAAALILGRYANTVTEVSDEIRAIRDDPDARRAVNDNSPEERGPDAPLAPEARERVT